MPHSQDDHYVGFDPVAQDVRPDGRYLVHAVARVTTSIRKICQAIGHLGQALCEPRCGGWIECSDISQNGFEMADRIIGPNDGAQITRRAWVWTLAFPTTTTKASARRPNAAQDGRREHRLPHDGRPRSRGRGRTGRTGTTCRSWPELTTKAAYSPTGMDPSPTGSASCSSSGAGGRPRGPCGGAYPLHRLRNCLRTIRRGCCPRTPGCGSRGGRGRSGHG